MNETIKLLQVIGSPFADASRLPRDGKEARELYSCAVKNKIPLFYLDRLKEQDKLGDFKDIYRQRCEWQKKFTDSVIRVSEILDAAGIEYALVKTIKPYPAVPNDVDILCLGPDNEYKRAVAVLGEAGYEKLFPKIPAARQVKLSHPEDNIWIDLHKELGVSAIICMNKKILSKYATRVKLSDNSTVRTLIPAADLAVIIVHSLITEQLYTLGELYATILCISNWSKEDINRFINIVRENNLTLAARVHINMTAMLHEKAYGAVPARISQILAELGAGASEALRCKENNFKTPHRYRLVMVLRALLEKMKEGVTRKSVPSQMLRMLNPGFLRILIKDIRGHRTREAQEEVYK